LGSFGFAPAWVRSASQPLGSFGFVRRWSARLASAKAIWEFYPTSADVTTAICPVRIWSDFSWRLLIRRAEMAVMR
jgi:hypothetical protein